MASVVFDNVVEQLQKFPGIGARSAERIAFALLRMSDQDVFRISDAIRDMKVKLCQCSVCFNLGDQDPCTICADPRRDQSLVCVVEQPRDLAAIESLGTYKGVYHVLMGHLAPMEKIDADQLTIDALVDRVRQGTVKEIVMATNPTLDGDGTALHIADAVKDFDVRVTRLARGLAVGGQLEFTSKATLSEAFQSRNEL